MRIYGRSNQENFTGEIYCVKVGNSAIMSGMYDPPRVYEGKLNPYPAADSKRDEVRSEYNI